MNWKKVYSRVLKEVCEEPTKDTEIVEVDFSKIQDKLTHNENAKPNSLFSMKLNDDATEQDYKTFCELIYAYMGLDIYNYLPKESNRFSNFKKQ